MHMLDQGYECMHLPKQGLETMKIEQITKCTRLHESKSKIQQSCRRTLLPFLQRRRSTHNGNNHNVDVQFNTLCFGADSTHPRPVRPPYKHTSSHQRTFLTYAEYPLLREQECYHRERESEREKERERDRQRKKNVAQVLCRDV